VLGRLGNSSVIRRWAVVLAVAGLYVAAGWARGITGLTLTLAANSLNHDVLDVRRVDTIAPGDLDAAPGRPAGITAVWQGVWEADAGPWDLLLDSNDRSSWTIDDVVAVETLGGPGPVTRTVWLPAGFHRVKIRYDAEHVERRLVVAAARAGHPPQELSPLMPKVPRQPRLLVAARALRTTLGWLTLILIVWAVRATFRRWRGPSTRTGPGRALAWIALACILVHGALLRIDAITGRYGPVTSPRWLSAVQTRSLAAPTAIRPAAIVWEREPLFPHRDGRPTYYRSDPYIYLDAARNMTAFYGAHFREPVFPFATKVSLALLGGQDVAVSFASTFFSLLAVWLTYVLGAAVWSRPAGLLAALGLSLDFDIVSLASLGWRDDAYMAAFTLCAYLMLRMWRTGEAGRPIYRGAVVLGVAGGLAILTRIMAVPFLVAGVGWILFARRDAWRRYVAAGGLVVLTAALTAGPYFVNCWRVYGDPFYTFNVHGEIYSAAEGQADWKGSTASYVKRRITQRPIEIIDTVAQGLTSYPFTNKWHGLDGWMSRLGERASIAALAGLVVLAASPHGRLLLIVTVSALLPFSLTWTVDPDFRFTVFAYPTLLIAAAVACDAAVRGVLAILLPARRRLGEGGPGPSRADTRRRVNGWRSWAGTVGVVLVVLWFVTRLSPPLLFADALRNGQDAMVMTGVRDGASFVRGWSEAIGHGTVRSRIVSDEAELFIRLPDEADYPSTLRMDPFPRPADDGITRLPTIELVLNGTPVATIPLRWTPARTGSYDIVLPRAAVRRGPNHLVLRVVGQRTGPPDAVRPGLTDGDAVALWYLRVHPATTGKTDRSGS
jgi:4-amino-4-deoxy-L-arabinose transferase-like glycosyltransferase